MIELRKYRIVDLSKALRPGLESRPLVIIKMRFGHGEIMHKIITVSHIGTHVEAPSHYIDARYETPGADISQLPLDIFIGEAVLIDASEKRPREPITPEDIRRAGVKLNDIVLIGNSRYAGALRPYLSAKAARLLADIKVKLVGFDDSVMVEEPQVSTLKDMRTHDYLLSSGIPIVEGLTNLGKLRCRRFFFIGLPVSIEGLDAFPIRAIALEPIGDCFELSEALED